MRWLSAPLRECFVKHFFFGLMQISSNPWGDGGNFGAILVSHGDERKEFKEIMKSHQSFITNPCQNATIAWWKGRRRLGRVHELTNTYFGLFPQRWNFEPPINRNLFTSGRMSNGEFTNPNWVKLRVQNWRTNVRNRVVILFSLCSSRPTGAFHETHRITQRDKQKYP